jgi:hypothetical protein
MDKRPLGILTNSTSAPETDTRALRYILQAAARELLPNSRVCGCMRYRRQGCDFVEVHKCKTAKRAFYKGVQVCGSVWICPVCASRITEERRRELTEALYGKDARYIPVMVTYTIRHHKGQTLTETLNGLKRCLARLKSGRWFQRIKEESFWAGTISALEITYGANGWHPHQHEIVLLELGHMRDADNPEAAQKAMDFVVGVLAMNLSKRWSEITRKFGFDATEEHGVTLTTEGEKLSLYAAKFGKEKLDPSKRWTLPHELAKAAVKRAKQSGRTPMQLLADYALLGDVEAGRLFQEYAEAVFGMRQLNYSRNLRVKLGLGKMSDKEIAEDAHTESDLLARLDLQQWRVVVKLNKQADLLAIAAEGNEAMLFEWLDNLPGMDNTRLFYE